MALITDRDTTIPEATARLARAIRPNGSLILTIRDTFGPLFADSQFAALFASTGQAALAPGRLAMVCVLQTLEDLSDRQAADAVAWRLDWKYALDLPLDDPGFAHTVLHDFRQRLIAGSAEAQLLTAMLDLARAHGWLHHQRQRTDSTHVLAATTALNRFELIHETLYTTLRALALLAPEWLQGWVPLHWYRDYGVSAAARRWPKPERERLALAKTMGADGAALLQALQQPTAPPAAAHLAQVDVLRQVLEQQYRVVDDTLVWRSAAELPSAAERLVSPYEAEARTGAKRDCFWDGYKVHLTETLTTTGPQLITHVETAPACEADSTALPRIQQALQETGMPPEEHVVDSGYMSAERIQSSREEHGIALVGPVPRDTSWQAQRDDGLDVTQFQLDWAAKQAIGPVGCVSTVWSERHNHRDGTPEVVIRFPAAGCQACALRSRCTHAQRSGRTLTVRAQPLHEELQAARARQQTAAFQDSYRQRAGVEGTISQGVRTYGLRRTRYLGQAKTHLHHILVALAINLVRIVAWVQAVPRSLTRTNPFVALAPAPP